MFARIAAIAALAPIVVLAQIRTDSSLGRPATAIPGPNYVIPQDAGRLAGRNLFHSFETFNVGFGESATFTASTPGLANILARVTGGGSSQVNGLLSVDAAGAHPALWLVNPAGVVFGNGATLNVPGGFHVTTANYIRFADGDFHADPSKASTFSSLSPEAYGFLGSTRASVRIEDGALVRNSGAVDIVAGDISIQNAVLRTGGGDIRLVAAGQEATTIPVDAAASGAAGRVSIVDGLVHTEASGDLAGGNISVFAGDLAIDGSGSNGDVAGLFSTTEGSSRSGDINVQVGATISIIKGGAISTATYGKGTAGDIHVKSADLLIDGKGQVDTGVVSLTDTGATGSAGIVDVNTSRSIQLYEGGAISSDTAGAGPAGEVRVAADSLHADGRGNVSIFTGISSDTRTGSSGSAGRVNAQVAGAITLLEGAEISSTSNGSGDAGSVQVSADSLEMDGRNNPDALTGVHSKSNGEGIGRAGSVDVKVAGELKIANGADVSADTYTAGQAGTVKVMAGSIVIDGGTVDSFTGISSDAAEGSGSAGDVEVVVTGKVTITRGGAISSDTYTRGNAGNVKVTAAEILADASATDSFTGISSESVEGGSGAAGNVQVVADKITLLGGALISSDTSTSGHAGNVTVTTHELVANSGPGGYLTGVVSDSYGSGNAGNVEVHADKISLLRGASISSDTYSSGHAGNVTVVAGEVLIDGTANAESFTGISSDSVTGASGSAGNVQVTADKLTLMNGGAITSDTSTVGNAGSVVVHAGSLILSGSTPLHGASRIQSRALDGTGNSGSVAVDVSGNASLSDGGAISSSTTTTGQAGDVVVRVGGDLSITGNDQTNSGVFSATYLATGGAAGTVNVDVGGALKMSHGGVIDSDTYALSNAGSVRVSAGSLEIRGASGNFTGITSDAVAGGGNAGDVNVNVRGDAILASRGLIGSRTQSSGNAGTVEVHAGNLLIDGAGTPDPTGISTASNGPQSGNAGRVTISVDGDLALQASGVISSATSSSHGAAGDVAIHAGRLTVDGSFGTTSSQVSARSGDHASGQTGNVSIVADESVVVSNGGQITVANSSSSENPSHLVASSISLAAPEILIASGGSVTAQSSGNVNASNIVITAPGSLQLDSGSITTSANLGNGGTITIDAGKVRLVNSQVTTSVLGTRGNGGDISIHADALLLETGFIQANTAARSATGGDVAIDVKVLAASGGSVFIGGSEPITFVPGTFGLNVIQAAAPTGVSGAIELTSPVLDTSGALAGLGAAALDTSLVGRSPCRLGAGSSLALAGRGGLAPSARDGFRIDPPALASAGPFTPVLPAFAGSPCRVARADF